MEHNIVIDNFEAAIEGEGFNYEIKDGLNVVQLRVWKEDEATVGITLKVLSGNNTLQKLMVSNPSKLFAKKFILGNRQKLKELLPFLEKGSITLQVFSRAKAPFSFSSMFNDPALSDLQVQVGEETLYLHKCIVSMHSAVFRTMLNSGMIESVSNKIVLNEYPPEAVKAFFMFMYGGIETLQVASTEQLLDLCKMACMYRVKCVRVHCEAELIKKVTIDNCVSLLHFAVSNDLLSLKYHLLTFMKNKTVNVQQIVWYFGAKDAMDLIEQISP